MFHAILMEMSKLTREFTLVLMPIYKCCEFYLEEYKKEFAYKLPL